MNSVNVINRSSSDLQNVQASYPDGKWSFKFGIVIAGSEAGYLDDELPPIPRELMLVWAEGGRSHQQTVAIDGLPARNNSPFDGSIEIVFEGPELVRIRYSPKK